MASTLKILIDDALMALHTGEYEKAEKLLLEACLRVDLHGSQLAGSPCARDMAYLYLILAEAVEAQSRDASSVRACGELLLCYD